MGSPSYPTLSLPDDRSMWSFHFRRLAVLLALAATATRAAGAQSVASYAPYSVSCPSDNLIRDARTARDLNPVRRVRHSQAYPLFELFRPRPGRSQLCPISTSHRERCSERLARKPRRQGVRRRHLKRSRHAYDCSLALWRKLPRGAVQRCGPRGVRLAQCLECLQGSGRASPVIYVYVCIVRVRQYFA